MTQAQEVRCLSVEQIETTMKNLCHILKLTDMKEIYKGKPIYSQEYETKYKLAHITKFADNYRVYKAIGTDPENGKDKYNMYFIVLEATKFDKLNISACAWFYHKLEFDKNINKDGVNGRPQVYICPAYVVTDQMFLHIPTNIIPCLYRFMSLAAAYPLIGSKNGLFGMTYDYKIIPYEPLYNGREYPVIYDYDIIVKILNALPGELICCKRVLSEGSPYGEFYVRRIVPTASDVNVISPSGLCDGSEEVRK